MSNTPEFPICKILELGEEMRVGVETYMETTYRRNGNQTNKPVLAFLL